ncbi:hypothetical protein I7I50_09841 [Histoplasma capsulatum G186AR]|uniref:Uncharacterized protein n=1 Tax=Ajellomyces capsulatus TaxID=5037 RepID=A0A8H7Z1C8_AJECA|nr:hypothetical protein I7I52_10842 [Histoplasma capsulatum]QSS68763.1 hypothetical protein I7I50_09841 [Histoplasma capsulatum G186AR]
MSDLLWNSLRPVSGDISARTQPMYASKAGPSLHDSKLCRYPQIQYPGTQHSGIPLLSFIPQHWPMAVGLRISVALFSHSLLSLKCCIVKRRPPPNFASLL